MVTRGIGRFDAQARRLEKSPLCELPFMFSDFVDLSNVSFAAFRDRIFTLSRTFWLFLYQVFSSEASCSEVVRKALVHLAVEEGAVASPNNSGYCQARQRLPQELVAAIDRSVSSRLEEESRCELWNGRVVKVADGSSVSMPDTPENRAVYRPPASRCAAATFPVMRLMCLFSLASGALVACEHASLSVSERALWRRMWPRLGSGDVVLGDRGFCGFADFIELAAREIDCVMRLHGRRSVGVEEVKRLGRNDWLVHWRKSKTSSRPEWVSQEQWESFPDRLLVRHVTVHVAVRGFRTQVITVATTLLDPKLYPARDLGELYRRRWFAELYLRDIKVSLGMDPLRCKSPAMVVKELTMYLIAYNLVRALMFRAAREYDLDPTALSYKQSLATVRQWTPAMEEAESPKRHLALLDLLLYYLAGAAVPHRPGRSEPRAKKRRPKNYQLLNKPRHEMQTIAHRNRYRKGLT
jgi:hypothetical protein